MIIVCFDCLFRLIVTCWILISCCFVGRWIVWLFYFGLVCCCSFGWWLHLRCWLFDVVWLVGFDCLLYVLRLWYFGLNILVVDVSWCGCWLVWVVVNLIACLFAGVVVLLCWVVLVICCRCLDCLLLVGLLFVLWFWCYGWLFWFVLVG